MQNVVRDEMLVNGADHTICGVGQVGTDSSSLVNHGRIVANGPGGELTVDPNVHGLENRGTLMVSGGEILVLQGGEFVGTGPAALIEDAADSFVGLGAHAVVRDACFEGNGQFRVTGSDISRAATLKGQITNNALVVMQRPTHGSYLQIDGEVTLADNGTLDINGQTVQGLAEAPGGDRLVNGKDHHIVGSGTITVPVFYDHGSTSPGSSPGILTIDCDYAQTATGVLNLEIVGSATPGVDFDVLNVLGSAVLEGTVSIEFVGYTASVDESWSLITTGGPLNGDLATVEVLGLGDGYEFEAMFSGGSLQLTTIAVAEPSTLLPATIVVLAILVHCWRPRRLCC